MTGPEGSQGIRDYLWLRIILDEPRLTFGTLFM